MSETRVGYLETLERSHSLLTDGATGTCLEHETPVPLDPEIGPTRLVDDGRGRAALEALYLRYLDVGRRHGVPMQVGTPTFRAGPERLLRAGYSGPSDVRRINGDCFRLLARLREGLGEYGEEVYIAGVLGPKGDCYKPEEAPGADEATDYHRRRPRCSPRPRWTCSWRPPSRPPRRRSAWHGRWPGPGCHTSSAP